LTVRSTLSPALAAIVFVFGRLSLPAAQAAMQPIAHDPVQTASGAVSGTLLPSDVRAYLGIPYAKPPVGEARWTATLPMQWSGVWNADRFGPECIQVLRPHDINHYFGEEPSSEDCLYLNVWVPGNSVPAAKLPVIVFIYGGGGTVGSAGIALYHGEQVAARGAVFVSLNYRIGILGFMAHPELSREQGGHSGNYGYLDQNAALRWIHDNIAAFGGDPAKVLIAGQSFGAGSVAAQLFSPLSKDLFRAAAMWSACNFDSSEVPLADAEKIGSDIQSRLGAASLRAMRNLPADRILALQEEHQLGANVSGVRLPPTIDGLFWTQNKRAALESHRVNQVPIMAGSNGDDIDAVRYPLTGVWTSEEYRRRAEQVYGANSAEFLKLFPAAGGDIAAEVHEAARESGFLRQSQTCASLHRRYEGQPTYIELFTRKPAFAAGAQIADINIATTGAYHTADVPFWFGTLEVFNSLRPTRTWTDADRALSDAMTRSLIHFAESGNPSTAEIAWPAWTPTKQRYVIFGESIQGASMRPRQMDWLAQHPPILKNTPVPGRTTRD
jgi:para-nitrobenzyl esterase